MRKSCDLISRKGRHAYAGYLVWIYCGCNNFTPSFPEKKRLAMHFCLPRSVSLCGPVDQPGTRFMSVDGGTCREPRWAAVPFCVGLAGHQKRSQLGKIMCDARQTVGRRHSTGQGAIVGRRETHDGAMRCDAVCEIWRFWVTSLHHTMDPQAYLGQGGSTACDGS